MKRRIQPVLPGWQTGQCRKSLFRNQLHLAGKKFPPLRVIVGPVLVLVAVSLVVSALAVIAPAPLVVVSALSNNKLLVIGRLIALFGLFRWLCFFLDFWPAAWQSASSALCSASSPFIKGKRQFNLRVFSQLFRCRARRLLKARASWLFLFDFFCSRLIFFFDFFCNELFFFYYFFFDFFLCSSLFFVFILYLALLVLAFLPQQAFSSVFAASTTSAASAFTFNFGSLFFCLRGLFFCLCFFCSEVVIDVLDGARTPVFLVVVLFINKVWLQVPCVPAKKSAASSCPGQ